MGTEQERYKILIVGDSQVGKTTLKSTYLGMDYIDRYTMTLGVDYGVKMFEKSILHIFDIGGQSAYEDMNEFFENAHGVILVFDITNYTSFDNIEKWVNLVSSKIGHMVPAVLVGNKSDLRTIDVNQVSLEDATKLSRDLSQNTIYEIPYFETSARTGQNVDHLFDFLIANMRALYEDVPT